MVYLWKIFSNFVAVILITKKEKLNDTDST